MADLLPSSPDPSAGDGGEPRVIGVDSDDADALLSALQSDTARDILAALYDDPATPSALADEVDTTIQTVRYHLEKLTDADLVEVADTVYSEKGREMKVYAPAAKPLVVFAGDDDTSGLETALSRLLGGLGVLGLSSLVVQRLFGGPDGVGTHFTSGSGEFSGDESGGDTAVSTDDSDVVFQGQEANGTLSANQTGSDPGPNSAGGGTSGSGETTLDGGAEATRTTAEATEVEATGGKTTEAATETVAETTQAAAETTRAVTEEAATTVAEETTIVADAVEATTTVAQSGGAGDAALSGLAPGLVFFAGGLVVLLALGIGWYLTER